MSELEVIPDDRVDTISNNVEVPAQEIATSDEGTFGNSNVSGAAEVSAQSTVVDVPSSGEVTTTEKPPLPLLVPSLKGKMIYEGGNVTCKGVWGMSDQAHSQPGQVSDFEFKLVKADEGSSLFPVNGRYQGWFHLKQAPPLKGSLKIEDKEMVVTFSKSDGGSNYTINGNGHNKFGSFTLKGTLSEDGDLHVYREYYNLTPLPAHAKRRLSADGADLAPSAKKKALGLKPTDGTIPVAPVPELTVSPREGSGRVRKQSSLMRDYIDTTAKPAQPAPKAAPTPKVEKESKPAKASAPLSLQAPLVRQESTSDRAHRLSFPLKKCSELLKELAKHPHSAWFLEPVDHIRLGIPDYPLIVTNPMDFGTIRKRIETNVYETMDGFADDMRLVFRNATTFNTQRDNPVHIAAREMSVRFEERFRVLASQVGGANSYSAAAIMATENVKQPTSSKKSGGKTPRNSLGSVSKAPSGVGPRASSSGNLPYLPPAVDGSSAHQLMEMQRMMQAMQNEISTLKSQVRENEIVKRLQETKDAAHNPLTFDEKKTLIAQIHKLPSDKMPHVLNIIQSALPPRENEEDGDIEVPLDALDTFTLRKLQKFIEENNEKKKRAPSAAQRSSTGGGGRRDSYDGTQPPKKARKSVSTSKLNSMSPVNGLDLHHSNDLDLFESSEDMLFEPDSFEEVKALAQQRDGIAQQQQPHSNSSNSNNDNNNNNNSAGQGDGGDDDEDFSSLMNMNHASGAAAGGGNSLDGWK